MALSVTCTNYSKMIFHYRIVGMVPLGAAPIDPCIASQMHMEVVRESLGRSPCTWYSSSGRGLRTLERALLMALIWIVGVVALAATLLEVVVIYTSGQARGREVFRGAALDLGRGSWISFGSALLGV
jgi:hypothetical protein